jgi:ubiquinone/menaquinone biosynthesis C-methylase UbiE
MNKEQQAIREQQQQSWNKFSAGWKKWDAMTMDFMEPVGREMIAALQPAGTDCVLDLAAGTGEPGLTIAGLLQGGKVMITDLSEDMLVIAGENAAKRGITNIDTVQCDVCELPFEDNRFDAISCRFGFMFFPDMQLAANEIARVLKAGCLFSTSVWNLPEKNFWVTAMMTTINKNMELPPPTPGAPGMFRCAQPGTMKSILEQAGLKNITEKEIPLQLKSGSIDNYWNMLTEVGAPIVAALSKADETVYATIKAQVFEILKKKYGEKDIAIEASAIVLTAEK